MRRKVLFALAAVVFVGSTAAVLRLRARLYDADRPWPHIVEDAWKQACGELWVEAVCPCFMERLKAKYPQATAVPKLRALEGDARRAFLDELDGYAAACGKSLPPKPWPTRASQRVMASCNEADQLCVCTMEAVQQGGLHWAIWLEAEVTSADEMPAEIELATEDAMQGCIGKFKGWPTSAMIDQVLSQECARSPRKLDCGCFTREVRARVPWADFSKGMRDIATRRAAKGEDPALRALIDGAASACLK